MTALIKGEIIKAITTRTLLAFTAAATALALVNVLVVTQFSVLDKASDKQDALAGMPILLLLFGLVGAAGEYRHQTATPAALVARRDRGQVLLARAAAYAVTGLAIGALTVLVSLAVGLPLLASEPGRGLRSGEVAVVAAGTLVAASSAAVLGAAVGALLRNQVAGVVGVLLLTFLGTEFIATIEEDAVGFTPFGAALTVAGDPGGGTLSWGEALLVLTAWTVPLLIAAISLERRRDLA
jgi:hypothetical protein